MSSQSTKEEEEEGRGMQNRGFIARVASYCSGGGCGGAGSWGLSCLAARLALSSSYLRFNPSTAAPAAGKAVGQKFSKVSALLHPICKVAIESTFEKLCLERWRRNRRRPARWPLPARLPLPAFPPAPASPPRLVRQAMAVPRLKECLAPSPSSTRCPSLIY